MAGIEHQDAAGFAKKRIARGDNPDNMVKGGQSGYGVHFRAVRGRYYGEAARAAKA